MIDEFSVVSVNVSEAKGTAKAPSGIISIDSSGIAGDAHRDVPGRGVSILDVESIDAFRAETGIEVRPGAFGENITTRGIDLGALVPGDMLEVGEALLEITAIGKSCHGDGCEIFRRVGRCVMPSRGVFCRVVEGGTVKHGDFGRVMHRRRKCSTGEP